MLLVPSAVGLECITADDREQRSASLSTPSRQPSDMPIGSDGEQRLRDFVDARTFRWRIEHDDRDLKQEADLRRHGGRG